MKINQILALDFNKNPIKVNSHIENTVFQKNCKKTDDCKNFESYPKNYYLNQISFGKQYSANELISNVGEENIPSPEILKQLRDIGNSREYSLYDIHINHYKDLLECTTLDEAKIKYPEFQDVIDASTINCKELNKKSALYKIATGQIEGISIDNLSLELLKRHYGRFIGTANIDEYFGITNNTICALFDILNIKKIPHRYTSTAIQSREDIKSQKSKRTKEQWANDDGTLKEKITSALRTDEARMRTSQLARELWANDDGTLREKITSALRTDEARMRASKQTKERWANDDGAWKERIRAGIQTDETRKKMSDAKKIMWANDDGTHKKIASQAAKKAWQNDDGKMYDAASKTATEILQLQEYRDKSIATRNSAEYKDRMKIYREAQILAWDRHPEITSVMSEIAKAFPRLQSIIAKKKQGEPLSEGELIVCKTYFKKCEEFLPEHKKIIGKEYHDILVEWGLKEE